MSADGKSGLTRQQPPRQYPGVERTFSRSRARRPGSGTSLSLGALASRSSAPRFRSDFASRSRLRMPVSKMPIWDEKHLRAATYAAGVALRSWNVETDAITLDERAYDLWGVSKNQHKVTFEILSENIHPADLERVRSAFAATRAVVGSYEVDFRILSGNDIRWISARGQGDDADIADVIHLRVGRARSHAPHGRTLGKR